MGVRASYLGLSVQDDGEQGSEETGRIGGWAIDILVNPGIANVVLHVVFLHRYCFKGYKQAKHVRF